MLISWYLTSHTAGLKALFPITLVCALACVAFCLYFPSGRKKSALVRLAVAVIAADGIGALILRRLTPAAWYAPHRALFRVSRREYRFYRTVRVHRWKGLVPELGLFTGFSKSDLASTDDPAYLHRFLTENNYGAVIHLQNALCGFVICFLPPCSSPAVWIPIAAVNFVLSLLPVAVLRYTSHSLLHLYERKTRGGAA